MDMKKYNDYITFGWWTTPRQGDVKRWIGNFGEDKNVADFILRNIIFYSENTLKSYTEFLINQLKNDLYQEVRKVKNFAACDDEELKKQWKNKKDFFYIMPACLDDVAGSQHQVVRLWRNALSYNDQIVGQVDKIGEQIMKGVDTFIFVDDFAGTGSQLDSFFSKKILLNGRSIKIGDIPQEYSNVTFVLALYVVHERAISMMQKKYSKIKLLYVDYVPENMSLLDTDGPNYETVKDKHSATKIASLIKQKCDIIMAKPNYNAVKKYHLYLPIVFHYRCPNNSLVLLYAQTNSWKRLF